MQKTCSNVWCKTSFEVTSDDLAFYDKVSPVFAGKKYAIPKPRTCPVCRMQRKTSFRNERNLYRNTCSRCKNPVISIYSEDGSITIYCPACWWGDSWDARDYGADFDFNRTFFGQVGALVKRVPFQTNIVINSVNCDYNVYCVNAKDCYMCQRVESENTLYSYLPVQCLWCCDSMYVYRCQYCYECLDCWDCYNLSHGQFCRNTSDSAYCYDCVGCKHCIGCAGLRNAEYMLFNTKCSKEEYVTASKELMTFAGNAKIRNEYRRNILGIYPRRPTLIEQSEETTGDMIFKSRNVQDSYDIEESQDIRDSWGVEYSKDIVNSCFIYHGEMCLENMSNSHASFIHHTAGAYNSSNLSYCMLCYNSSSHCFGCVNMRGGKHCILNKQYSEEEYKRLVPKIIDKMKHDDEWGDFFPVSMSPFAYNETVAQEYFPLTKKEAVTRGWKWHEYVDEMPTAERIIEAANLPESIDGIPDDILNWAIACAVTKRPFRIIKQELDFYRKMQLPIPRRHPSQRHLDRMALRNPRRLWERKCAKCNMSIATSYAPERSEIVYCEECYLKAVY